MGTSSRVSRRFEFGLLLLLGFLTAIPYALTKIAIATIPPITMVAARVSLAAVALSIVVFAMGYGWPRRKDILFGLFVQGLLACVLPYTLLAFGQLSVDSALTAILNSTTPLFVCLIGPLLTRHETLTFGRLFGVSIGLSGTIMLVGANVLTGLGQSASGQAAIILATAISAASIIHGRRFADIPPAVTAAGTLISAALVLVPLCFVIEGPLHCTPSGASLVALAINAFGATALGSIVYFRLIRTIGSVGTASAGYLKPAIGVLVGATLMGESLTWSSIAGLITILLGVSELNRERSSSAPFRVELKCGPAQGHCVNANAKTRS
jgi:drug/metabolite transporter (DMT)-like permease